MNRPKSKLTNKFKIRHWIKKDFNEVRKILKETWIQTYNFIPQNDLLIHLDNYYSIERLEELFNNPAAYCYSVEIDKQVIGWMKLFDNKSDGNFYLSSLYILKAFQGLGIGKELMNIAEIKAIELNHSLIWVGVMEKNINTLNWYKKRGFDFITEEPFKMGETEVNHLIGFKRLNLE